MTLSTKLGRQKKWEESRVVRSLICSYSERMCETVTVCSRVWFVRSAAVLWSIWLSSTPACPTSLQEATECECIYCKVSKQPYFAPFLKYLALLLSYLDLLTVLLYPLQSCIVRPPLFYFFAYSHPQRNWLLASSDSHFRRCPSKTAAHFHTDMWVLCFWNSCTLHVRPPAIFETAIDSVVRISIPFEAERQHSVRNPYQSFEKAAIGFFISQKHETGLLSLNMTITEHSRCCW